MSKRTRIVALTVFVLGFLLWGFGWPLITICLNLKTGSQVQELLLASLREKYPDQVFEKGGVGYRGPNVAIRISSHVDPTLKREMLRFVEVELEHRKFGVEVILDFMVEEKRLILDKSSDMRSAWVEQ